MMKHNARLHATARCSAVWRCAAALGVVSGALLGGCAGKAGVVFDQSGSGPSWPPPPDAARIRYVGQIKGSQDLRAERSAGEKLGELLFGKEESVGMVSPMGVCTDNAERVFIADSNAQVVHVFNLASGRYERWTPGKKFPSFVQPVGIAYDGRAKRLLVSDPAGGVVYVFDNQGACVGELGAGVWKRPCGIAVQPVTGAIAVADVEAHQVVMIDPSGNVGARVGARGGGDGQFNYPTFVAFDSVGRLYVSDSLNFRVQVFSASLAHERTIGEKGDMPGTFSQPKGVALDAEDHLYVVDANFEAVQVFRDDGALLMTFGSEGRGAGEFWLPVGVAGDSAGRVWVADSYNRRVQVFQYLGAELRADENQAGEGGLAGGEETAGGAR